jgi:6-phosphofructokinase 2
VSAGVPPIVTLTVNPCVLEDAVRFGVAAGAATVMNPGTALCRRLDAARLYAEIAEDAEKSRGEAVSR